MKTKLYIIVALIFGMFIPKLTMSQSVIYSNIISDNDTIVGELVVYKQVSDSTYMTRTKKFRNQSMISLDPGNYILCYYFNDKSFIDNVTILGNESVIVMNILDDQISLNDFNFSDAIEITPGVVELMLLRKKSVYIEF